MDIPPNQRTLKLIACVGLGLGGLLGMAGSFAPTDALRGLAWGIDGVSLVIASALLSVLFYRKGEDMVAAGYIVFAIGGDYGSDRDAGWHRQAYATREAQAGSGSRRCSAREAHQDSLC